MYFPLTEDQQEKFEKSFPGAHMFRMRCSNENEYEYLIQRQISMKITEWQKNRLNHLEVCRSMIAETERIIKEGGEATRKIRESRHDL